MSVGAGKVGVYKVGTTTISTVQARTDLQNRMKWRVQIFHSSGGLKKDFYLEQENNQVKEIDFETNLKGMGAGSILFTGLDFPLDPDDTVKISYDDQLIYQAIIDVQPDPKGGKVKLVPFAQRYKEVLYTGVQTTDTIIQILEDVVTDKTSDTGILWNASFVDITDTDTFTITYDYETPNKIGTDLVNKLDDKNWGVNEQNIFFVKELSQTVDKLFLQTQSPAYTSITVDSDYSKIKATRYQVYKKNGTSSETTRIGQVGYDSGTFTPGSNWPTLEIETITRKREVKLTVSEELSDAEALDFAYYKLLAETVIPTTIKLNGIDIDQVIPKPYELWRVQDNDEEILDTIIACDSTDNFSSDFTLDNSDYVQGSGSVKYTTDGAAVMDVLYDHGSTYRPFSVTKIGFMLKATKAGSYLQFSTDTLFEGAYGENSYGLESYGIGVDQASNVFETVYDINIANSNQWFYYEFPLTGPFRFLGWRANSADAGIQINIDRIQLFGVARNIYESNIVKVNWKINKSGVDISADLNTIDLQANDLLFSELRKIAKLEAITTNTT